MFKAEPTKRNKIGVNPKAFALRLRKICTDSDHQTAIAQDKNMMRFLLAQLKNADSSADMLIIVLQTLQFLLSHPSNVAFLYQTYPEFLTTVSDLTERDPPPIVAPQPVPAAAATAAGAAPAPAPAPAAAEVALPPALVAQHNARWKTVQILSQQLLDSLASYTNGDTTPKKPIRKPALYAGPVTPISAGLSAAVNANAKKYMFTVVFEVKHDTVRVVKMANRDAIDKALVALKGVVSVTINSEDPYTWIVTVYSTVKADALTAPVQAALKELKFDAVLSKSPAKAAGNSENVPPPHATPSAVNRYVGAAAAAAIPSASASTSASASAYATPKKPQHKSADDEWDSRNDAQALVEFDGAAGEFDRDHSRHSLQARKLREQQQKQRDASKSSVLGFFSSVTSYFF